MKVIKSKLKVFLLILCSTVIAGIPSLLNAQIFNHITPRDGITGGFINSIIEDSNGFLWFATNTGLDKYNGYEFVNFRADSEDSTTISDSRVLEILEYNETTFLIATAVGIDILNPATGISYPLDLGDSTSNSVLIYDFILQDENTLWAGVDDGLYKIDPTTLDSDNIDIQFFRNPETDPNIPATLGDLLLKDNAIWMGKSSGLTQFDIDSETFINTINTTQKASSIIRSTIWKILESSTGDVYIAADSGLAVLRNGEDVIDAVTELGDIDEIELRLAGFQTIDEDNDGNLWFGSGLQGAVRKNLLTDEITHFRADTENENSIQSNDVHFIFTGNLNEVWFGYHNLGLTLMFDRSWNYSIEQPFPDSTDEASNWVINLKEDNEGNTWLGTIQGIVKQPANGSDAILFETENNQNVVQAIQFSGNDIYGVITGEEGTNLFNFNTDTEEFEIFENPIGIEPQPFLFPIIDETIGIVEAGSQYVTFSTTTKEYTQTRIPQLAEFQTDSPFEFIIPINDIEGNKFVSYLRFLPNEQRLSLQNFRYEESTGEFTSIPISTPSGNFGFSPPSMSRTRPGVATVRINSGLFEINYLTGESSVSFESEAAILAESDGFLMEDDDGYFWTINSTGIMRLDPVTESISYFELDDDRFESFGVPSRLSNGDMVFPGSGGVLRFNPDQLQEEDPISNIHINSLQTGDEIINILYEDHESLEIPSSDNNISFLYTGINYKEPTFTQYRYKLIGYSDEWNEVGTQRNVFVPNLPPADYKMQVQAASRFGGFTGPISEVSFTILPPFWLTIPAYILYFLIFVGGVISVDRFQRKRLLRLAREKSREKELEQAREIEIAYNNLQAAQEQLVQQEKLASLGQLTAGIAHEIKNPLNFVNNFSDLSVELLEEAREELEKTPADAEEALEILKDVEANLKKIHEHGSRADSIVKSMLQHSRGGSGKLEPTDLNALVKEYVNLSFHGMRAGKNPINVDIQVDLDESLDTIPLIGEDFSRVIINLCNNAFDAMRTKLSEEGYKPKLTVKTEVQNGKVLISIEDNGPGIPDHFKDRILQPFFTTKKGTEGTGLGLSITNDIIKAHRGILEIETKNNEFTRFNIFLTQTGK